MFYLFSKDYFLSALIVLIVVFMFYFVVLYPTDKADTVKVQL